MKKNLKIEKEIKLMFSSMAKAYQNHDVDTTMSFFSEKADVMLIDSALPDKVVGRKKIESLFKKIFSGFKSTKMKVSEITVFSENNHALAYAKCNIETIKSGKKIKVAGAHWTVIFEKLNDRWKIIYSHFSGSTTE
ncbi:nuclear transport factor 2 family protein [Candidatus Dependentiae bacterium]|nr:nuclear transport factor 2 family protein [Candidatus Dependentiae bacterium]